MRNLLLLFAVALFISSCAWSTEQGTVIPNPSAEEGTGSAVTGWNGETRGGGMIAFYDYEAHHGKKSLMLQSNRPAGGRWMTRVELRPWSEYKFTGWVKTEGVQSRGGKEPAFVLMPLLLSIQALPVPMTGQRLNSYSAPAMMTLLFSPACWVLTDPPREELGLMT
ncbi:MAG: hypothetical protein R2756_02155 [Bacteroidales bacterium]